MPIELLPDHFEASVREAVSLFWKTKKSNASASQGGTRSSVLSGKHLDGFLRLSQAVAAHVGLEGLEIVTRGAARKLPGYFRASKDWDVLMFVRDRLVVALEFKSMVGSFGNNQNNRIEEVIGLGQDFWTAGRRGLLGGGTAWRTDEGGAGDPRPPFVGYLMLVESTQRSRVPVGIGRGKFKTDPIFDGASYVDRFRVMAERLLEERLYTAVAILLAENRSDGQYESLSGPTSIHTLYSALAAHLAALRTG